MAVVQRFDGFVNYLYPHADAHNLITHLGVANA